MKRLCECCQTPTERILCDYCETLTPEERDSRRSWCDPATGQAIVKALRTPSGDPWNSCVVCGAKSVTTICGSCHVKLEDEAEQEAERMIQTMKTKPRFELAHERRRRENRLTFLKAYAIGMTIAFFALLWFSLTLIPTH